MLFSFRAFLEEFRDTFKGSTVHARPWGADLISLTLRTATATKCDTELA